MSNDTNYREISRNGFWNNNPALVQLLGLCPLLAVSSTVVNALALGMATTLTLLLSNTLVSLSRHWVRQEIRVPMFVIIIAAVVTVIDLALEAALFELHGILGIFIPLIVTNCSILGRAESFAFKHRPLPAAVDGITMGLGFTAVLVLLGALREAIGRGTLFSQAELLFGDWASALKITIVSDYDGFLLAILPPGAFIGLAMIVAVKNVIDARGKASASPVPNTRTDTAFEKTPAPVESHG